MSIPWKKSYDKPRQCIAKQKHLFADRGPFSQNYNFSSSHVWMWELNHKEVWGLMNWCFQIVVLGKTLESPLDSKEIKPVNPRGNQSWIFIGRTDAEAAAPSLWPPDAKNWLTGKDPDAGKDWGQEERATEDERDGITDSMAPNFSKLWEIVKGREDWGAAVHEVAESRTRLSDWRASSRHLACVLFIEHLHLDGLHFKCLEATREWPSLTA